MPSNLPKIIEITINDYNMAQGTIYYPRNTNQMFRPTKRNKKPSLVNPPFYHEYLIHLSQSNIYPSREFSTMHKQYNNKYS